MLNAIGEAVTACLQLRRWQDLEAAIGEYARTLGLDPTFLLASALLRLLYRSGMQETDLQALAECMTEMERCQQWARRRPPLPAVVNELRLAFEHARAFDAFDAIWSTDEGGGVH